MNLQMVGTILNRVNEKKLLSATPFGGWRYRLADYDYDCRYTCTTDWAPLDENTVLPGGKTVFAECEVTFPAEILCGENDYRDYLFLRFGGLEGTVTVDGELYQGHDGCRDRFPLRPEWAGRTLRVEVMAFSRKPGRHFLEYAYFGRVDLRAEDLAFSMQLAWDYYNLDNDRGEHDSHILRESVLDALRAAMLGLDTDAEGEAFRAECDRAAGTLAARIGAIDAGDVRGSVCFVGHTHIDVAWLWHLKDTVRKCAHTFSNVLRLMDEYPDFTFACSQMVLLDYTREHFPTLYAQIRERIAEGRFELIGTMWVESDCNVVSGESLVRQILYGVGFMEREFGRRNEIAWLPDTFGFQPNLPQILKKTGTKYFYSNKIHWQGQNRFPYDAFRWRGIDGSEVTAAVPLTQGFYNGSPEPDQVRYAQDVNLQAGQEDDLILPVGHGDGGGGPTREMILKAAHMKSFPGLPRTRWASAASYFEKLDAHREALPVWYGDLYIETHRGTLTTVGRVKRANRRAEIAAQTAEKLGVAAARAGLKPHWEWLAAAWKELLTLQFHDILPGSSVDGVYDEDCAKGYEKVFSLIDRFTGEAAAFLAGDTRRIFVYNPLGFARAATVSFPCADRALTAVCDAQGRVLPTSVEENAEGRRLVFRAEGLPALGASVFTPVAAPAPAGGMEISEDAEGVTLSDEKRIVRIDREGRIARLYDREADREALSAPAGDLKLFLDGPQREDAWNLYPEYREREVPGYFAETTLTVLENSALRTRIGVEKRGANCRVSQEIVLCPDTARIDFVTRIDWHEQHRILRVYFPCNVRTPYAALEEGFGTFYRPTVASTSFERSRFEVCAHKFVDLSEGSYGVAVLNDCKYGHDVQDNVIGISLLRGTTHPSKHADEGMHEITYAILPHAGDWRTARVAREGLCLNTPALVCAGDRAIPAPVECDCADLILDTCKPAEDGNGVILRLYESNGNSGKATLSFDRPVTVTECDLLEHPIGIPAQGNTLPLRYTPYEIKTFRVSDK